MSKGGSSGATTVKNEIDPDVKAAYLSNLDYARDVGNQLGARQFADFGPQYQSGEQQIAAAAQGGAGMQNLDTAADLTRAGAGYSPMQVNSLYAGPAQADMSRISQYMNPYTKQVIDASMADLEKARQTAAQQVGQRAMAANAFGGSRHGVAEALSNAEYGQTAGKTIAQLRQQGFDTAANLMQQDLARQQQSLLANQSVGMQSQLANQTAGLQGAQQRMAAAQQLGTLGQAQTAGQYQAGQALMGLGQARQNLAQQQMDAARNLGLERLNIMQSALGLQPGNLGNTQTSPYYENTGANMLGGALMGSMLPGALGGTAGAIGGALLGLI